jgi:hypothetical protein
MYARGLCFVLAMSIGVAICAEERKAVHTFSTNVKFRVLNSSLNPVTLYVDASRKKGQKAQTQNLGTCGKYGNSEGGAGIYYHTNTTGAHANFYVKVNGQSISNKPVFFNGLATNPSNGNQINPAAQHLTVNIFGDNTPESYSVTWTVTAGL